MLTLEDAQARFAPHERLIAEAVALAGAEYWTGYPPAFIPYHNDRERANVIYSHMRYHAVRLFSDVPGVRINFSRGLFTLVFGDWGVLKFKLLGSRLETRNVMTQQTFNFLNQLPVSGQLLLPEIPDLATNFHAGYRLNDLKTGIAGIFIVAPLGRSVAYYWPLQEPGAERMVELPQPQPQAPTPATRRREILPKRSDRSAQNE